MSEYLLEEVNRLRKIREDPEDKRIKKLEEENKILRRFLWLNHGCETHCLYGDDGEMQCGKCIIDFKRDSIERIMKPINDKAFGSIEMWKRLMESLSKLTIDDCLSIMGEIKKIKTIEELKELRDKYGLTDRQIIDFINGRLYRI